MRLDAKSLGAEPKKVITLVTLLVVAAGSYFYMSSGSGGPEGASATPSGTAVRATPPISREAVRGPVVRVRSAEGQRGGGGTQDFRVSLKKIKEETPDLTKVDPSIKLDLLAKLRGVDIEGGNRSLFEFSQPPAPPPPKVDPIIVRKRQEIAAAMAADAQKTQVPAAPPPPPPIPLKFYGFVNNARTEGPKRAFFLEGDDIFVAAEGELVKNRYKIIRIGVNSALVEDTSNKSQQTLALQEEQVG